MNPPNPVLACLAFLIGACAQARAAQGAADRQAEAAHASDAVQLACRERPVEPEGRPRVGLALGGGGVRGIAHISVLRKLEEMHVPIDCIAGTSMGVRHRRARRR